MDLLVNIDVDDIDRALAFYTSVFDLEVGRRFGTDGVELLGASSPIYLLKKAAGSPATPGEKNHRHYNRHWTPVHLDFVVKDIDAFVARAAMAGATLEKPVEAAAWGKLALLADPFGHGVCLVEFLGEGYDEIASPSFPGQGAPSGG